MGEKERAGQFFDEGGKGESGRGGGKREARPGKSGGAGEKERAGQFFDEGEKGERAGGVKEKEKARPGKSGRVGFLAFRAFLPGG